MRDALRPRHPLHCGQALALRPHRWLLDLTPSCQVAFETVLPILVEKISPWLKNQESPQSAPTNAVGSSEPSWTLRFLSLFSGCGSSNPNTQTIRVRIGGIWFYFWRCNLPIKYSICDLTKLLSALAR